MLAISLVLVSLSDILETLPIVNHVQVNLQFLYLFGLQFVLI